MGIKRYSKDWKVWAGILLAQFLLFYSFSKNEDIVSFFSRFFELKRSLHQTIFSVVSFSIGDLLYILCIVLLLIYVVRIFTTKNKNRNLLHLLKLLNVFYFLYQIFWGLLYFKKTSTIEFTTVDVDVNDAKKIAVKYVNLCNATKMKISNEDDILFEIKDVEKIKTDIILQQKVLFKNKQSNSSLIETIKPSLFSGIMSYTGILGYYNPFTTEAQYNAAMPPTKLPFTLAHETAHQLGFAREQDANFIGYLMGHQSNLPELQYSTELFVLKNALNYLENYDEIFVKHVKSSISKSVIRDLEQEKKFYEDHSGILDDFFSATNNWFLKSNQQGGTVTYSYAFAMIIQYEKKKNRAVMHDSKNTNDEKKFITF